MPIFQISDRLEPAFDFDERQVRADRPRWTALFVWTLLAAALISLPGAPAIGAESAERSFVFSADSFSYENELAWQYVVDAVTGEMVPHPRVPRPDYSLHCFAMVRAARQFFDHARFEPGEPKATPASYRQLVRRVYSRNPRAPCRESERIVIPGYSDLREFSRDHEVLLKAESGKAWHSFVQRGNWRMVFPFSRRHQQRMAERLVRRLQTGRPAVVHVVRFPALTINHVLLLFGASETEHGWTFAAYDPNETRRPASLFYDRDRRRFCFPSNKYFSGGPVDTYEIYRGLFY